MSSSRQQLREKSQDFAVRYHEALEADDYELAEKLTLEHLHLIDAYVAGVIGEDDHEGCALFDEFGYHGKECDRPGGCIERLNRDELRAEQRRRAGIGGDK